MKRILSVLFLIIVFILFVSIINISDSLAQNNESTLTIVFTHDLHDHLMPFALDKSGVIKDYGGYDRIQSAINKEREKDPDLILLDAGDFSMGTLFQTIYSQDAPSLSILGQMGYDATTLGNHEFDFRAQGLADSLNAARKNNSELPELLISNIAFPEDEKGQITDSLKNLQKALTDFGSKEYSLLERDGKRIGVFGLIGYESASNAPMAEVEFTDTVEAAKRIVKILKENEKADVIICLSHSGTSIDKDKSEDELLAQEVPGIDVIISGHSHTKLEQPIIIDNTIICSAGEYGENIGILKIGIIDGICQLANYQILQINDELPSDLNIMASIEEYIQNVETDYLDKMGLNFDEVLAYSPRSFLPAAEVGVRHAEEPLANLITDAYIYAVKKADGENYRPVDVAVVPSGTIRGSIVKGDITVSDAYIVSSLGIGPDKKSGYPLISVYLTGKELKTACEVDASIAPIMNSAQLYMSGMSYTFNPNRLIFNKVTKASLQKPDGTLVVIDDNKLYRVVAGLYSAQMLSVVGEKSFGILSLVPKDKNGVPITNFEEHIIKDLTGGSNNEIKEWEAIAQFLQSFPAIDGVPQIPLEYYQTHGRKNIIDDNGISAVYGNPNHIAAAVYSGAAVILLSLILLVYKLVKRRRKNQDVSV